MVRFWFLDVERQCPILLRLVVIRSERDDGVGRGGYVGEVLVVGICLPALCPALPETAHDILALYVLPLIGRLEAGEGRKRTCIEALRLCAKIPEIANPAVFPSRKLNPGGPHFVNLGSQD